MFDKQGNGVNRRGFLISAAGVGTGAILAGCTGNSAKAEKSTTAASSGSAAVPASGTNTPGKTVTIGFSAPAADSALMAAGHQITIMPIIAAQYAS